MSTTLMSSPLFTGKSPLLPPPPSPPLRAILDELQAWVTFAQLPDPLWCPDHVTQISPHHHTTTSPHSSTRQPERKRAQAGNNGSLGLATSWVQINLIHNSFIPNLARGESNASIPFYLILFYVSVLDIIITIMLLASMTLEHNVEIKCPAINHLKALLPTLIILSLLWRTTRIWAGLC